MRDFLFGEAHSLLRRRELFTGGPKIAQCRSHLGGGLFEQVLSPDGDFVYGGMLLRCAAVAAEPVEHWNRKLDAPRVRVEQVLRGLAGGALVGEERKRGQGVGANGAECELCRSSLLVERLQIGTCV